MTKINLKSKIRDVVGKQVKEKREEGLIPAVMYGSKIKNQNIWIKYLDFLKTYEQAGENTIVELDIDGKKMSTLIYDVQMDPLSGSFTHVDFFQVRMDEKIEAEIPLEFFGEAPAVKELGGTLVKSMDEISVKCLPNDLPSKYEMDLSELKTFEDYIKVKDVKITEKVEILLDPETIIASVSAPRTEEELSSLDEKAEGDVTKVEGVVKKDEEAATEEEKK